MVSAPGRTGPRPEREENISWIKLDFDSKFGRIPAEIVEMISNIDDFVRNVLARAVQMHGQNRGIYEKLLLANLGGVLRFSRMCLRVARLRKWQVFVLCGLLPLPAAMQCFL